jgi:ABC-type transport system substrate-binding protein
MIAAALLVATALARVRPHYGGEIHIETSEAEAPDFIKLLVTETLTTVNARGEVLPGLADRWQSQNGGSRWLFHLRPAVRLHGTETDTLLTLAIASNSIRTALARSSSAARVHGSGEELTVEFDAPLPQFAALVADARFAISSADEHGTVVGSGPYMIQSIAAPRMTLVANSDYWGGRHYPETIIVTWSRSPEQQWMDLSAKHADLVEVPPEQLRHAQQERARLSPMQTSELVVLSAKRPMDARLRQSLSESVDRTALLNFIFQKQGEVAGTLLPQWMTGYATLQPPLHDAAHARQLRSEFGGRGTFTIGYEPGDATLQLAAERLALNAREAGWTAQAVARTKDVDWLLERVPITTANPAAALTGVLEALHRDLELSEATLESVFRAERNATADYTVIPLLHLNRAWAASNRLRDWNNASAISPLPAETWVESKP